MSDYWPSRSMTTWRESFDAWSYGGSAANGPDLRGSTRLGAVLLVVDKLTPIAGTRSSSVSPQPWIVPTLHASRSLASRGVWHQVGTITTSEQSALFRCRNNGSSLSIGAGSADQLRLLEEVGMELRARVEDLDPDEPAVLPVEDDEGVDARRCSRWDAVAT